MAAILLTASIVFGLCLPGAVYGLHVVGYLDRPQLSLFGIGVTVGFVWEFALVVVVPPLLEAPLYTVFVEVPIPSLIHVAAHSFWDGGLFLAGALLVRRLLDAPHFRRFRWPELGVLVVWGQLQSLVIELVAVATGLWTYHPTSWNPALFRLGEGAVTVAPQAIWLLAAVVFYRCCLYVYGRDRSPH
jgi:hypothetical protein